MVRLFRSGPVWHEVWPARWGFYRIYECDGGINGLMPGRYHKATVFGRVRAAAKARVLQERVDNPPPKPMPAFTTKPAEPGPDGEVAP
jgi:hypothetical protein